MPENLDDVMYENIVLATKKYPSICLNMDIFVFFLSDPRLQRIATSGTMEEITKSKYAKLHGAGIYVDKMVASDCIRVSKKQDPELKESDWSPNLKLEDFDRLIEMKAFW